jgi:heterodisulfide reductase subunit A-like polyferredoxin
LLVELLGKTKTLGAMFNEQSKDKQPFLCRDCNSPCSFEQTVTDENEDGIVHKLDIYRCDKCNQKWSD